MCIWWIISAIFSPEEPKDGDTTPVSNDMLRDLNIYDRYEDGDGYYSERKSSND